MEKLVSFGFIIYGERESERVPVVKVPFSTIILKLGDTRVCLRRSNRTFPRTEKQPWNRDSLFSVEGKPFVARIWASMPDSVVC